MTERKNIEEHHCCFCYVSKSHVNQKDLILVFLHQRSEGKMPNTGDKYVVCHVVDPFHTPASCQSPRIQAKGSLHVCVSFLSNILYS